MSTYSPDKWHIVGADNGVFKVLGGWSGGYLDGDSWRLSSGLQNIEQDPKDENYYLMHNYSGSIYRCHKKAEGFNLISSGVFSQIQEAGEKADLTVKTYTVEEFDRISKEPEVMADGAI